jgi:MYXO-CTERM domain-containing protein
VVTDPKATGAKILAAVAPVRIEKGLTCGIAGYPAKGCGDQVKNIQVPATDAPVTLQIGAAVGAAPVASPSPVASSSDSDGAPWGGIIIAAVVVVVLAGGGLLLSRRRTAK